MTNQDIESYLEQMNTGAGSAVIFPTELTPLVTVARLWPAPRSTYIPDRSYQFFFFRGDGEEFAGAIQDAGAADMHAFVAPQFRRHGYLRRALMDVIFPWLAQKQGRKNQAFSFEDPKLKRSFARMGFKSTGPLASQRSLAAFRKVSLTLIPLPVLTESDLKQIASRLKQASQLLAMATEDAARYGLTSTPKVLRTINTAENALSGLTDSLRSENHELFKRWV